MVCRERILERTSVETTEERGEFAGVLLLPGIIPRDHIVQRCLSEQCDNSVKEGISGRRHNFRMDDTG